jgi:hypothetical protein
MAKELFVGVLLMAVSGLTFVAYRHPRIYLELLFDKLYLGALVIFMTIGAWDISSTFTFNALVKLIPIADIEKARLAVESLQLSTTVVFTSYFCFAAYMLILSWLARHFEKEHSKDD